MRLSFFAERKRPLWHFLVPPMLLLSLGLHGVLLFVPLGPSDSDLLPPPDPEDDGISITRIDPPRSPVSATATDAASTPGTTPDSASTNPRGNGAPTSSNPNRPGTGAGSSSQSRSTPSRTGNDTTPPSTTDPSNSEPPDLTVEAPGSAPASPNPVAPSVGVVSREVPQALLDLIAQWRGDYAYSAENTAEVVARENLREWLDSLPSGRTPLQPQQIQDISPIQYRLRGCLPIAPGAAWVGVMVDDGGAIVGEPMLLKSTGYPIFDERSLQRAERHRFASDSAGAYILEIPVTYAREQCIQIRENALR